VEELTRYESWSTWKKARKELTQYDFRFRSLARFELAARVLASPKKAPPYAGLGVVPGLTYGMTPLRMVEIVVRGMGITDPDVVAAALLCKAQVPWNNPKIGGNERVAEYVRWGIPPMAKVDETPEEAYLRYLKGLKRAPWQAVQLSFASRFAKVQRLPAPPQRWAVRLYRNTLQTLEATEADRIAEVRQLFAAWRDHYDGYDQLPLDENDLDLTLA
jgi:guanosine-3',5'-bis(diphosphate) 3'-pyrophosphohydrolase